jgi:quercetin dioxygenase-like cupin family protein
MRKALNALAMSAAALAAAGCTHAPPVAAASAAASTDAWTEGVRFVAMGSAVNAEAATVAGAQNAAGLYTVRVKIAKGGSIAPHTHPDTRILTVVSGEVWYGFGDKVDLANAKLYATGAVFTVPANAPHWAEATTSDVVYQEAGMGPTAFTPVR